MKIARKLLVAAMFLMSLSSVGTTSACPLMRCGLPAIVSNACYVEYVPGQPIFKQIVIHDPLEPRDCAVPLKLWTNGCQVTVDTRQRPAKIITFERTDPDAPTLADRLTCPE